MFKPLEDLAGTAREKVTQYGVLTTLSTGVASDHPSLGEFSLYEREDDEATLRAYRREARGILKGRRGNSTDDVIYRLSQRVAVAPWN